MLRRFLLLAIAMGVLGAPGLVQAGVFIALDKDLVDPSKGENPTLVLSFSGKLKWATVRVVAETGGEFSKSWDFNKVVSGKDYRIEWKQPAIEMEYQVSVEMQPQGGEVYTEDMYFFVASAAPITASIPASSVDLETRSFDLVSNHPPSEIELEVMDDRRKIIGKSTFRVTEATPGKAVRVTWEQQSEGNIFRITATARDAYGYWAGVEIIPWNLEIPHEDVVFETGSHTLLDEEIPKLEPPWRKIVKAVEKYAEWVQCSLYVAGYTDTVGGAGPNQGLSERRALSLARYLQGKGASFPIYYRGYGEAVLAVATEDSVDMEANRRALYVITAGPPPTGADTPGGAWKKLR